MKAKELIIVALAGVMILTGAVQIFAQSQLDEQLNKFYKDYISEKIAKVQAKISLKTSRSANLRLAAAKAEKQAEFLTVNKDILADEMVKQDIGQKPYKVEKYLNERFFESYDCIMLVDSNAGSQPVCK